MPVPPLVELTWPVVLVATPAVLSVTLAVMVQLEPVGIVAPLRLKLVEETVAPVSVPPSLVTHVPPPAADNDIPLGKVSVTPTPVSATVLPDGFVMVIVIVEVPFTGMPAAEEPKALAIVGGETTVNVALAAVPVPSLVVVTVLVVLFFAPLVVAVTSTLTSQLLFCAMVPPLRLIGEAPEVNVPPQVLLALGVPAMAMPAGKVSVKATPFMAPVLAAGLVMVIINVDVPLSGIVGGIEGLDRGRNRGDDQGGCWRRRRLRHEKRAQVSEVRRFRDESMDSGPGHR